MQAKGRAAVYTRSATKGMDTDPIEAQSHAAYNFADKENLKIVKCVDNIGTSGIRHFPTKLRELILWASENNVSDLIVYSIDRITRSVDGMREFFNLLDETGITPRFVAENFPDDPDAMCDALFLQSFVVPLRHRKPAKHVRKVKGNAPKISRKTSRMEVRQLTAWVCYLKVVLQMGIPPARFLQACKGDSIMFERAYTVLYFRISSNGQHHETSIDTQIKAAKKQAEDAGISLGDKSNSSPKIPRTMQPTPLSRSRLGTIHRGKRANRK